MSLLTFISDFGQKDEWVAVVKGVIKNTAPKTEIIDISHEIPSFSILKGSLVLQRAVRFLKADIHLAVVDPGVGKKRKGIIVESLRGDIFVGPDNGLLEPAANELGIKKVFEITNQKYFLKPVSPTFHARDIFAPVCSYIINGKALESFGDELNPLLLNKPCIKKPIKKNGELILEVLENDKYGTARLNLPANKLAKNLLKTNKKYQVIISSKIIELKFVSTFDDLDPLEAGLVVDSSDQLSIFINKGSAANIIGLKPGKEVRIKIDG